MSSEMHASKKAIVGVFVALIILTVVTVAISRVDLGSTAANIGVGLLIAVIKASLVTMIFMQVKYDVKISKWFYFSVLFPAGLVVIMILGAAPDVGMNAADFAPGEKVRHSTTEWDTETGHPVHHGEEDGEEGGH